MVIGLDSARTQLQWRLIHADKVPDTPFRSATDWANVFGQRSAPSLPCRAEPAPNNAQAS